MLYKYNTTHRATNECGICSVSSPPRLMGRVVVTFRSYSFEFYRWTSSARHIGCSAGDKFPRPQSLAFGAQSSPFIGARCYLWIIHRSHLLFWWLVGNSTHPSQQAFMWRLQFRIVVHFQDQVFDYNYAWGASEASPNVLWNQGTHSLPCWSGLMMFVTHLSDPPLSWMYLICMENLIWWQGLLEYVCILGYLPAGL